MGCVNVSSREFKDLATRHNLDSTAMELIVHKYWLETGKEDLFPTDVYIQAQLGNGQYKEESSNVRKLWDKLYSSNKEYDSLAKVEAAIDKASRFFPSSAISYYRNAKGNYVLSVKKPVKKINNSKDDFFDAMDNMKSMRDVKSLNLDIKEKQTYGIGKVQELYNRFNTDRTSKDLADRVFGIARDLGIQISFNESLPFGTMGRYHSSNTIIFKKSFLERDTMNDKKASILLHEVLHAVTMYALSDKISDDKKSKALNDFKVEMNFLYQDLKNNPLLEGERGIVDVKEFVAELGNPVFRSKLQQIDRDNAAKEKLNQSKKSLWNRVLDAFKHLLGLHTTNSYYQRSMNALDNALNAFDIDTYMRYSGIKNHLRKETANIETKTQYNAKLSVIDNAAQSGNWTSSALKELDNLIDDIENGKATYQRFPQEAARGWHQGGRANEAASLLLRTNESSSTENTRSFSESQRRSQEEKPIQERIIENWAKAEGIWHDNLDSIEGREFLAEGGEAKVFANSGDTKVTKILSTGYFITPQLALDRITLHNTLFPIAPMKVIGFGRNSKGEFQLLVEQPFIQGEPATQEEIDKYISKMGFIKSQKNNGHTFVSDDLYLSDLHDENVIKTPQGILVVIDADLRLNTPELEMGGKYQVDDSVLSLNEYQAKEFIKTLSSEQLEDETKLIQQESADYDVAFAIEEEPKKSKAVPQDFTFNDGTKVKAPFMPNAQQIDALNAMSDFIKSDATSMTLSGYAGTGKTSLMEMIAQKCRKDYRDVIFCASTNKAATVLNDKVKKSGFKASTLNKIFGISVELDTKNNSYNAKKLVNALHDVDIDPGTTVIIDEASMINEENYKILNQIAAMQGLKIIYVGDSAQLAPVNESKISKVFRNGDGKVITLTQVERTDDNAILKEATDIRNGKPLSGESSFNSKGEGVAYIPATHKDAISEVISHYVKGLKKDPNFFRILAYTNKAVAAYNNYVRKLFGYTSPTPQAGEPMTGYENWGYDWKTKTYRFINSESYKVIGTSEPKTVSITLGNGTQVTMQAIPLTLEDSLGNRDTFDFMDIKSNRQNREAAIILANEKKRLYALAKKTVGKKAKAEIYQQINTIDKFLFVNDNIIDDQGNYLQTKTIDFGYALTVHKSQGSTFTHVLMDDVDISKATSESTNNPMIVEDVNLDGKAIDVPHTIIDKEEKVDLGDLTPAIVEQKQDNPQTVNLRQQLEYVGVSRATDTVTIISNDVKKEGSPLHPEKNLKDNTINPNDQRSDNTESHQGFISDSARQLVEHLKSMGLNVMGRAAMEKFFKEHPDVLVQMARAYSKEKPYLNSKYKKQVPQILDIVKANKYDKPGTDAVTLESEKHKTIYLIDHSADSELADNLKKGDGFGIRSAFNVEHITEEDVRTIIRNIAPFYDYSTARVRNVLQTIGLEERHLSKLNLDDELKRLAGSNNAVYGKSGQGQSTGENGFRGYYDNSGKQGSRDEGILGQKASSQVTEDGTEFYTTPQGEVYGFVDKDGNIYLDETKISPEHPIHEYTHLWDRVVAQKNTELWNRGVSLMKQTSMWNDVLNDANYGKKWQAIKGISQEKLESLVASEVHSRLVGKDGADILAKLAKEKGKEGIIAKLKQWVLDVWKDLKATFGDWSKDEIDKLTLEDFNNMTVRDLANGLNPLEMKENTINNNSNNGTEYKQTDEFRRVQEAVRKGSHGQQRSVLGRNLPTNKRQDLANVLGRQLRSIDSFTHGSSRNVVNPRHNTIFNIHSEVNPQLFHDIFEVVRYYADNGELVDLHNDYSDCKCYLSEDGTAGFAVESDGNLVSVFNLGTTKGFLSAIKDLVREAGATHLDAYASSKQDLQRMYEVTLGFHTAATMDYNMEYDHDDIAKNHGNPQVVFMVDHEVAEPKHFDKDSYDDAKQYQMQQLEDKSVNNLYSENGKSPLTIYRGYAMAEDREASNIEETIGHTAVDYVDSLKGAYYFTSDRKEAMDYAKSRTDKSEEEFYRDGKLVKQRNRHYTGDFAKVSTYYISANAKVEHYKDMRDFSLNGKNSNADVIILEHGTLWHDNKEYIVRNPSVIVASNQLKKEGSIQNPTFEEAKTFTVKLLGYEYFNDLYEDSAVDAEWKIPYLKELDAQLSLANSEEKNQNIINQMNKIFQATDKEEYLQESKTTEVDKQLREYEKLIQQFDNLLEGGNEDYREIGVTISASEIRHTAELVVNSISDEITRLQNEEGRAKEIFPELNTDLDFKNATRKEIVEAVGINNLINRTKELFSSENARYDDIATSFQADLITDNWDAFMMLASDIFAFNEGFGITKDFTKGNFATTDKSTIDYDNFQDYSNDEDARGETGERDEQEHWQIESKTIDVLNSMSALVKQGLHECYQIDSDGNKVMSKWGIAERVNPRQAVNSILRWTQGSQSLDDMIKKMSDKQIKNPWLSQLIGRLSDKSGKETDFQSQFYSVFQKHFQLYSIMLLEDGKYHNVTVNSHPALTDAMRSIVTQFKIGEHPLFTSNNQIKKDALGNNKTTGKSDAFNLHRALYEMQEITKALNQGNTLDEEMAKTATDNIMGVCRLLGYPITEDLLTDVINPETIKSETNYLTFMVNSLNKALKLQEKGQLKNYQPFAFGQENGIDGSIMNFLTPITDQLEDTAVNAFYDSGKMYQSYVIPSFLSKLMNKFKQDGQAFEDFIMEEYGNSEWFAYKDPKTYGGITWRNEWLRLLASKDGDARKMFDHKVELNFNKHNYMRNMSDTEYTISLIAEYFSESMGNSNMEPAWYRIPMQSNKPSSDFIKFYSDRMLGYQDRITSHLYDMFLQELSRIQTVRMRNLSKNDPRFIKNFDSNGKKFNFLPVFNAYLENTPTNIVKRKRLHNGVEYDADRLDELQEKENLGKKEAAKHREWEKSYISQKLDEDPWYEEHKDPIVIQERQKLRDVQLSLEENEELSNLQESKKADDRKLSTEEDDRFASLLQKKLKGEETLTPDEEIELSKIAHKIIYQYNHNRVQDILDRWEKTGIIDAAKNIKGIYPSYLEKEEDNAEKEKSINAYVRKQVENFLWNDSYASKNILQLTITDIAFYKDAEDLQKRLAQLHAPGVRGRKEAIDYSGNRVSADGKYRTAILSDFDTFKSNIIANITEVFDRKIREAKKAGKDIRPLEALKESLVAHPTYNEDGSIKDKGGKYWNINVTDAQGYSSPSSYRKKAFIFGKWSRKAEDIYQKLLKGDYKYDDLETAFQPLKPFVYSRMTKNLGTEGAPISSMPVPFQAKNAEYLLIMADAILSGEKLSRPNLLRAVYRVMEDSAYDGRIYNEDGSIANPGTYNGKGIDTIQFESAIKSSLQGKINLHQFLNMEHGEEAAYTYIKNLIYKKDAEGNLTRDYDTDTFIHETSFDDYCLQQEVPEHFKAHSQSHGSQIRMITPSDLDFFTTDENGNQVDNYYEWKEPDGTVKRMKADEFRKEYEQTIADQIEDSIDTLAAELHLNEPDPLKRNLALSKILQREILSSPRYGIDLIQACAIDKETGDFRIPKGDPIQAKRIEQLINSIIKNRVNKQKIAGGPIVQVSNFGTSRQLHIRFNDKQGNLMPLEEEYNPSEHDNLSYKDYIKKHQGGIAYFEVFAPIWSNELFDKFANADGSINIEAIEATDPELLKMVSYRIPTEDKYSCAPMKVVGFMPREAGDAIMLPYELTEIDDSDFDVDKRYVMRKDIPIKTKRRKDIEMQLFTMACKSYKKAHNGQTRNGWIKDQIKMFMDNPQKMKNVDAFMQSLGTQYQFIAYETEAPTSGRIYRDNKIIDMTYAVLTNQMTADKILNPGGFDAPKKMGYMVAAYKNPANNVSWEDLQKKSIDELKDLSYTDKDLTFADTQVQFYKQNAAAASLIGIFAVNKVAHATLESNGINLCISDICGDTPITIAGTTLGEEVEMKSKDDDGNDIVIKKRMQVIDAKYDNQNNLIGKTLGSLVSASADAVKDPILNLMNINQTTAGILNTMLRFGMPFDDAALFLSQNIIERVLNQFNKENLSNSVTLDSIIDKWLDAYRKKYNLDDTSTINSQAIDKKELIEGLTSNEHEAIDYKVLLAFKKLKSLTDVMRKPTYATRFNSISSAVGPLIIDNLIMEHTRDSFKEENMNGGSPLYSYDENLKAWIPVDIDDIFYDHPILEQFARTVDIAKKMFLDMPAGSNQFRALLNKLPKDISDKMYGDRKLLSQFSDFYQSYLLIQSGVVNPNNLKSYMEKFPVWFMNKEKFKEKYPNNALIQAIRMNISNGSKNPYLTINITGMDEPQKEELKNAWIDLHKENPELSKMLFDYNFFRAGIGFSPKTFMSLVPTYVKMRLQSKDGNATYVDTYRNFPDINKDMVIEQFIRNNMNNNKLVPWKGGKDTKYDVDTKNGRLIIYRKEDKEGLQNVSYMKTSVNKVTYLWHYKGNTASGDMVFEMLKPLGNNGEYLEMDTKSIVNPFGGTTKDSKQESSQQRQEDSQGKEDMIDDTSNDTSYLKESAPQETDVETSSTPVISEAETVKDMSAIADLIQKQVPKLSHEEAEAKANEIKNGNIRQYRKFLQNVFKQKGLTLNEEEAMNEFKKYC